MAENSSSLINNSAVYLLIILNATALAVLVYHDSNFSIDVKWTMITEDQILRVKTASSIKLFTSTILLGAYAGLLVQRQIFAEEIEPGVVIDRIDMRPLRHFGFLQMCVRVCIAIALSLVSIVPWLITSKSDPLLKKVFLAGMLPRFLSAFMVFAFFRKIDQGLHTPQEFEYYEPEESEDELKIE